MRYDCPPPFAGCFVEYVDAWSVREWHLLGTPDNDAWLPLIRAKTVAMRLETVDGTPITALDALTPAVLLELDIRLYAWWRGTTQRLRAEMGRQEVGITY